MNLKCFEFCTAYGCEIDGLGTFVLVMAVDLLMMTAGSEREFKWESLWDKKVKDYVALQVLIQMLIIRFFAS